MVEHQTPNREVLGSIPNGSFVFFFFFFLFSFTSLSRLFQLMLDGPIDRWGENGRTMRKTTWHTRKQNLACLTCGQSGARTHTRHSGEMVE